jgi:hypothetical protein
MEIVQQQTIELLKGFNQLHSDLQLISWQLVAIAAIAIIVALVLKRIASKL